MAYIDLTKITDVHAKRLVEKNSSLAGLALENAEVETRMVARSQGVLSEDIPMTGSNFIQSEALYVYCQWRFLFHLFTGVAGSFDNEDIYRIKLEQAQYQSTLAEDRLNYFIITEKEVTNKAKRSTGIRIS